MADKLLSQTLTLIDDFCTNDQVRDFLREKQELDDEIRLPTNANSLAEQLSQAYARNTVSISELYELIRRAEENGRQHFLLYKASVKEGDAAKKLIADPSPLLGASPEKLELPQFRLKPEDVAWADFRVNRSGDGKVRGWTAKAYLGDVRWVRENDTTNVVNGVKRRVVTYVEAPIRSVIVLKYHIRDRVLEVRHGIHKALGSSKALAEDSQRLWGFCKGALDRGEWQELALGPAIQLLKDQAEQRKSEFRLHNVSAKDDDGDVVKVELSSPEDDLTEAKGIKGVVKAMTGCSTLSVTWLRPEDRKDLPDELLTTIGYWFPHEFKIKSKTTPEAVDYVLFRLRELV